MKTFLVLILISIGFSSVAQKVTLNPNISPALFTPSTSITVTYDVNDIPSLKNLSEAWIWLWLKKPGVSDINATTNINPATATQSAAKFTKTQFDGRTVFTITFVPNNLFAAGATTGATGIGMLLKASDWTGGQTSDFLTTFWDGSFQAKLTSPTQQPLFVSDGETIPVSVETPVNAKFTLFLNNVSLDSNTVAAKNYSYDLHVDDSLQFYTVKVIAKSGTTSSTITFDYIISHASPDATRPAGIIDGINYSGDQTKVTLSLWAPQKTSVYVLGDFNQWKAGPSALMKRDGEHFWLEVAGLTSGTEYGYQYLVDETLFVADPYADKILDPDDQYIPATTYPDLKPYPALASHTDWYFNRVSVLQTGQTPFAWQATNYVRPTKEKLVIYELLVRDFFGGNDRNYQNLIDTIGYFKRMGINAIELMPVTEFNGNDSWGYNPTFMFAPDKYYGTKNKFKEFIDLCHQNGIAVIMDMVLNHQDLPNPYALMYFNFGTGKPTPSNPWFNVTAPHPFSVFNDLNHSSSYTKKYVDTVNYHWLHDYKIDGLRFDLSKGFTQTVSNESSASNYDASRIAILKRMADVIWSESPDAYVILEHFTVNAEEMELANYRADEGKGLMPWGNFNNAYNQSTMGFETSTDFSSIYYVNRGWDKPRSVGYMESHDEERLMYKNLTFGNSASAYNVKTLSTALDRMKAANILFLTIPGPKMIWEFGELGYDKSINTCSDGTTISTDCRVSAKPVPWNYMAVSARVDLMNHIADLIRLRNGFSVFTSGTATITSGNTLQRTIDLKHVPYTDTPADSTELNAHVVVNLDVTKKSVPVVFSHTGTWYDYYADGASVAIANANQSIPLDPGEFKLYTDVKITHPIVKTITGLQELTQEIVNVYPNPTNDLLNVEITNRSVTSMALRNVQGVKITPERQTLTTWDLREVASGFYIAEITSGEKVFRVKVIRK